MAKITVGRATAPTQYHKNVLQGIQIDLLPSDEPVPSDAGYWFIAKDGETTVGFAVLKVCAGTSYGYLARSGVYPEWRGKGLQRRMIAARERYARRLGLTHMVCDTARFNLASSNSLIRSGYTLYEPLEKWAHADGNYWIKAL